MGQETRLRKARDSLEDITKKKRFAVGVTEEREETKFCEGGEGNGRHINADRLRGGSPIHFRSVETSYNGLIRYNEKNVNFFVRYNYFIRIDGRTVERVTPVHPRNFF